MKNLIAIASTSLAFLVATPTSASMSSGWRDIIEVGCHTNDSTCYATLDTTVGYEQCRSTSIRWNKDTAATGKETLSLIMAAGAAGKKVRFNIIEDCYGRFPTFNYINVKMK